MPLELSGKITRDAIRQKLASLVSTFDQKPVLAIFQVGNRPDSDAYISQKKKFAESIGVGIVHKTYSDTVGEEELIADIQDANSDKNIHGILVQLPIPKHLNAEKIIEAVDSTKDVDGLTAPNAKAFLTGLPTGIMPATARGIIELLNYHKIPVRGKNVTVIGRSNLVGMPVAAALLNMDATVTIAHKQTQNLSSITLAADILVVAIGDPEFIDRDYLKKGQVVIDVGINIVHGRMVGDVKKEDAQIMASALTPVPGGVGPMTVAALFENLIDAFQRQNSKK